MFSWFQCYASAPVPKSQINDWAVISPVLFALSDQLGIPFTLLAAQAYQESTWKLHAYRYEPGYDLRHVSSTVTTPGTTTSPAQRWSQDPAWYTTGPTIDEWFKINVARAAERVPGLNYSLTAQTGIAASYGPVQCMYPTAIAAGFKGAPAELFQAENMRWGMHELKVQYAWATETLKLDVVQGLKCALAAYNGGQRGNDNPATLRNVEYVRLVNQRHLALWGGRFFGDL